MITNKLTFFIGGFVIGLVISFFVANSQYQKQTTDVTAKDTPKSEDLPPGHPTVDSDAKASISSSKTGPLEAFGAVKAGGEKGDDSVPKAETAYKNIRVLKGLPSNKLMEVMKGFSEGLGVNCKYCHVSMEEAFKDDLPTKATARQMLQMVREINKNYPTGGTVTCFTCHRGSAKPAS